MRSSILARVGVSPKLAEKPSTWNSGLESAKATAKASSMSSPMSVSMMTFSGVAGCAPAIPAVRKRIAVAMPVTLRIIPPHSLYGPYDDDPPRKTQVLLTAILTMAQERQSHDRRKVARPVAGLCQGVECGI